MEILLTLRILGKGFRSLQDCSGVYMENCCLEQCSAHSRHYLTNTHLCLQRRKPSARCYWWYKSRKVTQSPSLNPISQKPLWASSSRICVHPNHLFLKKAFQGCSPSFSPRTVYSQPTMLAMLGAFVRYVGVLHKDLHMVRDEYRQFPSEQSQIKQEEERDDTGSRIMWLWVGDFRNQFLPLQIGAMQLKARPQGMARRAFIVNIPHSTNIKAAFLDSKHLVMGYLSH